ncbi:antichymotrypsin-2-like [Stomoxys calcitrans]|uniref:antichymotrypsin-2-like n=1 Tax=Stomoxys calcitrans TaxID=35570 RepID=UPI0027E2B177|nr:antichymotrypsin-2-like [Stomoxys calcitrans]
MPTIIFMVVTLATLTIQEDVASYMSDEDFSKNSETFGFKLFTELSKSDEKKNVIFSPFSIQTCLAMARMGAAGETAVDMDNSLGFPPVTEATLAEKYFTVLSPYTNSNVLEIANKIYVMKDYEVKVKYNELLQQKFISQAENINFAENDMAAKKINSWVDSKTNHLIQNLISPNMLNNDTRLVLLNAIHFKGEWCIKFKDFLTRDEDFYLDETNTVTVKMMHATANFRYGDFPDLDATALEMFYKNSDLSILVLLPKSRTGLAKLQEDLRSVSLNELTKSMITTRVIVSFPKFKADLSKDLSGVLKEVMEKLFFNALYIYDLGMKRIFSTSADFSNMLNSSECPAISSVIHKACIDVNEKGTSAAAATATILRVTKSVRRKVPSPKIFKADHGFYYFVRNSKGINMFQGSQKSLSKPHFWHLGEEAILALTNPRLTQLLDESTPCSEEIKRRSGKPLPMEKCTKDSVAASLEINTQDSEMPPSRLKLLIETASAGAEKERLFRRKNGGHRHNGQAVHEGPELFTYVRMSYCQAKGQIATGDLERTGAGPWLERNWGGVAGAGLRLEAIPLRTEKMSLPLRFSSNLATATLRIHDSDYHGGPQGTARLELP